MYSGTLLDIAMMHSDTLVQRARKGEASAQSRLVELWYKRIYNYGFKFFTDHDLAMEVAQKTFISMYRSIHALNDSASFKPWLYRIAVNACREEARRRKPGRSVSLNDIHDPEAESSPAWEAGHHRHQDPERTLRQAELADLLHESLAELSEEQREVVLMKEYEGMKFREIADVLGVNENTVKSRLYYGLTGLRKILERKNITPETVGYEG
jgi:RNA polymerase sigma-70 factor (ECF subfamily)